MALKSGLGDEGRDLWEEWSQTAESYSAKDAASVWKSIETSGPVGMGTLYHMAKQYGFRPAEPTAPSARGSASDRAEAEWRGAMPEVGEHRYLRDKAIKPHGVRTNGHQLIIPIRDAIGRLQSLQKVAPDGRKRFLAGGSISGHYFAIGVPGDVLCIAEGFATGASIHEATGHPVAVAFNCGNLEPVARALRQKYPIARLIVCGDDDSATQGNPGRSAAIGAANAVGGLVAFPHFGPDRLDGWTDFNDLMRFLGVDAVRSCVDAASHPPKQAIGVLLRSAKDIKPEPIRWLWPGYLATGKLHVLAGAPGTGKTNIGLALAACISAGRALPDGTTAPIGNVVIWSGEDDAASTIVPRLIAMGADLDRIHIVEGFTDAQGMRAFDPANDMASLAEQVGQIGNVRLLLVDPIVSAVPGDSHKNAEVRRGLQPLVDFGHTHGAAVLGISHFTKGTSGRDPLERVTGSMAFGAVARVVFGAARISSGESGADEGRMFVRVKSNIGPDGGGFKYDLQIASMGDGIEASRVAWGEALEGDAKSLLSTAEATEEDDIEGRDAASWLRELLANGSMRAPDIKRLGDEAGFPWRTVQRARCRIGAQAEREGFGGSTRWHLPIGATRPSKAPLAPFAPLSECGADGVNGGANGDSAIAEGAL